MRSTPERIVIVGGGMTAHHFIERILDRLGNAEGISITLLCEESEVPYDRVHLSDIIEGRAPSSLRLHSEEWYRRQGIRLALKERVRSIDRVGGFVRTDSGQNFEYDRLILATGGEAFRPPIPGAGCENVTTYRTTDDAERIRHMARAGGRVVVAGGGLLGLEAARAIRKLGCKVEIVEMAPRLLPRQLDADGADVLRRQIRALGLSLRLLTRIEAIAENEAGLMVHLSDDDAIAADAVVFAAGIRPRDGLAREAGLDCHRSGGIEVDDALQTSDASIFAIGECARHRGELFGFVAPCYAMAEVLASRFAGGRDRFEGSTPSARLKIKELDVASVGESLAEGPTVRDLTWLHADQYRRIVLREGRIVGGIAVGSGSDFPRLQESVAKRTKVRAWHERRFARSGRLWQEGSATDVRAWPDAAVVCTCTGVTRGALRELCSPTCATAAELSERSGAGTVCGSCQPLLAQLAGELSVAARSSAGRGLVVGALVGGALVAAGIALEPIPMASSIRSTPEIDFLWRDGWWKQASGFTLLALCVASLVLSLRKRWKRFSLGAFARWRLVHVALGVATLVGAGMHTGLRMGQNLNFVLMSSFVGVVALGSATAGVTAIEHRLPPPYGGVLRRAWTWAHILIFWPMPVLVGFHVLAVYFY